MNKYTAIVGIIATISIGFFLINKQESHSEKRVVELKPQSNSGAEKKADPIKFNINEISDTAEATELKQVKTEITNMQNALVVLNEQQQKLFELLERFDEELNESGETKESRREVVNTLTPEQESQKEREQLHMLEDTLINEETDEKWSQDMTEKILTSFETEGLSGLDIVELSCASSLCKLQLQTNSSDPENKSMSNLAYERPWEGQTYFQTNQDGSVLLYFARDGHDLPSI